MDTVYPEPMSRLYRRMVPKKRHGLASRYRTQPITFSEIQEVDEENEDESTPKPSTSKSEMTLLNNKFEEFKKSHQLSKVQAEDAATTKSTVPLASSKSTSKISSRTSL